MNRIFHYTKINTLNDILKTHSIRLNALKNMDDLLEGKSLDELDFSNYYYASSWTRDSKESIPMWYMYTDNMRGVRIEADENFLVVDEDLRDGYVRNCIPDNVWAFKIAGGQKNDFLVDVDYSDKKPQFWTGDPRGYISEDYYNIGKVKPLAWDFQKEVRFRLQGISKKRMAKFGDTLFLRYMNAIINSYPNDVEHIDIQFETSRWKNANFILGPNTTFDELEFVKSIVHKYIKDYEGKIEKSYLQIRFK